MSTKTKRKNVYQKITSIERLIVTTQSEIVLQRLNYEEASVLITSAIDNLREAKQYYYDEEEKNK